MISLILTLSPRPPPLSLSYPFLPKLILPQNYAPNFLIQKKKRGGICTAELQQDAPFAIAIGACLLNSLLFSDAGASAEKDEDAAVSTTDARFAVMTFIGFIPYFNWLSWVFALMDTSKRRYAVYALVYLAPYLRTNLSISPEESWLPITSIVLCVIHIQLEVSNRGGDLDGFHFFNEAAKHLGFVKKHSHSNHVEETHEARRKGNMKLPLGKQSGDDIRKWRVRRKPSKDLEHFDEDGDIDDGMKN